MYFCRYLKKKWLFPGMNRLQLEDLFITLDNTNDMKAVT